MELPPNLCWGRHRRACLSSGPVAQWPSGPPAQRHERRAIPRAVRQGFTLMEMLVTASIVGILAATALPLYQRAVERGYWRSAQDILRVIHAGEQTHRMVNNGYTPVTALQDWRRIYMDSPNVANTTLPVTFAVTTPAGPNPPTFTATATRIGNSGCVMTINQDGTLNPSTIDALPAGCIP